MFDQKTILELKYYVYMLLDPKNNEPFYVGKGTSNRVFNHMQCALTDVDISNAKYDKIRTIKREGNEVKHIVVRHGLTEKEAYQIEASLIDSLTYCGLLLSNIVTGHKSVEKGLMTTEEITRLYNAEELNKIGKDCVLININKRYKRGTAGQSIYQATKETWSISRKKTAYSPLLANTHLRAFEKAII